MSSQVHLFITNGMNDSDRFVLPDLSDIYFSTTNVWKNLAQTTVVAIKKRNQPLMMKQYSNKLATESKLKIISTSSAGVFLLYMDLE